jgi:hypothetical protein
LSVYIPLRIDLTSRLGYYIHILYTGIYVGIVYYFVFVYVVVFISEILNF